MDFFEKSGILYVEIINPTGGGLVDKKDFLPPKDMAHETRHTLFFITYSIVLIVALLNLNNTMSFLMWVFALLTPFIIGLVIAFIINIIMNSLEKKVFAFLDKPRFKLWHRMKRGICLILSFLIVILVIAAVVAFMVPQLVQSMQTLSSNMPGYIAFLQQFTNNTLAKFNLTPADFGQFAINWSEVLNKLSSFLANISPGVLNIATGFTSAVFNFFMGLIFAIYLLLGKESLIENVKNVMRAYLSESKVSSMLSVGKKANTIFTSFVVGQLTEAVILGTMYFIGTSIFRMPYVPLISSLMAVCSLIPMFGPIIGAVPSAFLLLMVDPNMAVIFVIMAVVFQQIEGNFIYPRVVGSSVGLPGMWVLFAILIGGSFFGPFGMIISVPCASLAYTLLRDFVKARLKKKGIDKK